jgi:Ca2+-binding RTX toxin-like protein
VYRLTQFYLITRTGVLGRKILSNNELDLQNNALNNRITGNEGNNTLNGAVGRDTLTGGNDVFQVAFSQSTVANPDYALCELKMPQSFEGFQTSP